MSADQQVSNAKIKLEANNNQCIIDKLSHDGRGVITHNGKKVLIDGVIPGEKISWVITKRHRRYDEAKVESVLEPAPERVAADCPNFLTCGGCSYQHISNDKQIEYKQEIVQELLEHIGGKVKVKTWLPPLTADPYGYRTKARLGIKYVIKKDKLLIGFREKSSSFVTDMDTCSVLHPNLNVLMKPLADLISTVSIFDKIPQVELAMGDNDDSINGRNIALILRHLEEFSDEDLYKLKQFAKQYNINLLLQPKGPDSVHCIFGVDRLYYMFEHEVQGENINIKYDFHPQDFTQVNLEINKKMLKQAIALLDLSNVNSVLDLFCGLGNFTLPLAKVLSIVNTNDRHYIEGIEGSETMVKRAQDNSLQNGITNIKFKSLDLYNNDNIDDGQILLNQDNKAYDCVVLDPPRSGAKELLPILAKSKIKQVLYVSCDPATFARDVGILCNDYGYKLEKVGIMDMFPHTKHVETMGLLKQ